MLINCWTGRNDICIYTANMNIALILKTGFQLSLVLLLVATIAIFSTQSVEKNVPTPKWKPALIASGIIAPVPAKKPEERTFYKSHQITPATFDMMTLKVARLFVHEDESMERAEKVTLSSSVTQEIVRRPENKGVDHSEAKPAKKTVAQVARSVKKLVRRGRAEEALAYVHENFTEKPADKALAYDRMIAHIASGYLYQGRLHDALALSEEALKRSQPLDVPEANWVAGLSLWQMEQPKQAASHFENASISAHSSKMMAASASYWAARAYQKIGQDEKQSVALHRAAQFPNTFYGILAAQALGKTDALIWDEKAYPVAQWAPKDGYRLDPSLLNAIIRQESYFKPNAKSYSGARGLMQVMPETAKYIAKIKGYEDQLTMDALNDPEMSMKLGQDYVEYLFKHRGVDGDMISMLVAYNAGPGNLLKWRSRVQGYETDPLLLIEMLPVEETRDYVEKVMANYWIYRMRDGQNSPSLASLAVGQYHRYGAPDAAVEETITVASY